MMRGGERTGNDAQHKERYVLRRFKYRQELPAQRCEELGRQKVRRGLGLVLG